MPREECRLDGKEHICEGCDSKYSQYAELWFSKCVVCNEEICMTCRRSVKGLNYCNNCKPIETNYFERSVE